MYTQHTHKHTHTQAFPFVKVDLMGGKGQKAAGGEGNYDLSRYRPPLQVSFDSDTGN